MLHAIHFSFFLCLPDLYVVEFQKKGLPHIHVLVWLKEQTRDPTPNMIDIFISAEIPDVRTDPLGYALVEEFMMHGPCGDFNPNCPCMKALVEKGAIVPVRLAH